MSQCVGVSGGQLIAVALATTFTDAAQLCYREVETCSHIAHRLLDVVDPEGSIRQLAVN